MIRVCEIVQVKMKEALATLGHSLTGDFFLDEGIDAIRVPLMTDVHRDTEAIGIYLVHERDAI